MNSLCGPTTRGRTNRLTRSLSYKFLRRRKRTSSLNGSRRTSSDEGSNLYRSIAAMIATSHAVRVQVLRNSGCRRNFARRVCIEANLLNERVSIATEEIVKRVLLRLIFRYRLGSDRERAWGPARGLRVGVCLLQ